MTGPRIPFLSLTPGEDAPAIRTAIDRVVSRGWFVLVPEVEAFESEFAAAAGAAHAVGVGNGTDAIALILRALGIGAGDEVITTPISFVASTGSIVQAGATPVYADVRDDQNVDPAEVEKKITSRTKAIMPVHWGGRIADMDPIVDIAKRHGLHVIEDAAQSMGAYYKGRHGGRFGVVSAFSCHPLKNLNAIGDGGFMLTDDDEIARKSRLYRNHGLQDRDTCVFYGINSRLDVIHAEVLSFRLGRLKEVVERRRKNVNLYRQLIKAKEVFIPPCKPHEENAFVMLITQAERRDELQAHLSKRGVQSLVYYGTPLHLQPAAARFGYKRGDFPVAERQAARVLALPHHQNLSDDQVRYVADAVNAFYGA